MEVKGPISKIVFNKDNFFIFTINKTKVSLNFPTDLKLKKGLSVLVKGSFIENEKYGRTFVADSIEEWIDNTKKNMLSIYIDGIGEKKALEIEQSLGEDYMDKLKKNPLIIYDFFIPSKSKTIIEQWESNKTWLSNLNREDLPIFISKNMSGIGIKRAKEWINSIPGDIQENILNKEMVIKYLSSETGNKVYEQIKILEIIDDNFNRLIDLGYPEYFATKLVFKYKENTYSNILINPYLSIADGMDFKICDNIAIKKLDFEKESFHRVIYGVIDVLKSNESLGNTFMLKEEAIINACKLLKIEDNQFIESIIDANLSYGEDSYFVLSEDKLYRKVIYYTEKKLARTLLQKSNSQERTISSNTIDFVKNSYLEEEQKQAVIGLLKSKVAILTGGPGTGKTTCLKILCQAIKKEGKTFALASPTGRASKRLQESTGFEAKTIHRLLEYKPRGIIGMFMKNENYPIIADYVLIDESSMLDVFIMNSLLKAIKDSTTLIFIGDADQLPSISMGSLLKDMKDSGAIPVYKLSLVHRQSQGSYIVKNANNVKDNRELELIKGTDFVFKEIQGYKDAHEFIKGCIRKNKSFQILTPIKNGPMGTNMLNELMQINLNPASPLKKEIFAYDRLFREGDKVIQLENDYNKEVYNGEMGVIEKITNDIVTVYFPDNIPNKIDYKIKDLKGLDLSYSISIHKSQGSEFSNVILAIDESNKSFLSKELIYTGITRCKKGIVVLSNLDKESFATLKTSNNRATSLHEFLTVMIND